MNIRNTLIQRNQTLQVSDHLKSEQKLAILEINHDLKDHPAFISAQKTANLMTHKETTQIKEQISIFAVNRPNATSSARLTSPHHQQTTATTDGAPSRLNTHPAPQEPKPS